MSSIQNAMQAMGYFRIATHAGSTCRDCAHAQARTSGLRCVKGFFYVSPVSTCREFAQAAPPEADDMALPPGKSCADCLGFERCLAFIGAAHINERATRCDWSPSHFVERARKQIGPTDV